MKVDELKLLKENWKDDYSVDYLLNFLDNLFDKKKLPVLVGNEVRYVDPENKQTELTIESYTECLRSLKRPELYNGNIFIERFETFCRTDADKEILLIRLKQAEQHYKKPFNLSFKLAPDACYRACSYIPTSMLEKECERFQGPNIT